MDEYGAQRLNLQAISVRCNAMVITVPAAGAHAIVFSMNGGSDIQDKGIHWGRAAESGWMCSGSARQKCIRVECRAD